MSRVVRMILETERHSANELRALVRKLGDSKLSRFQYTDVLLQASTAIARLRGYRQAEVFEQLSALSPRQAEARVEALLSPYGFGKVA